MVRMSLWSALLLAFLDAAITAQQPGYGRFLLRVEDVTGAFVQGAKVTVSTISTGDRSEIQTDAQGEAQLNLSAGAYDFSVRVPGFVPWKKRIELSSDATYTENAVLEVGGTYDPVWITADDTRIETESATLLASIPENHVTDQISLPGQQIRHCRY